jgi:hypothetical protein
VRSEVCSLLQEIDAAQAQVTSAELDRALRDYEC